MSHNIRGVLQILRISKNGEEMGDSPNQEFVANSLGLMATLQQRAP